jgi:hypothetical protein
MIMDWCVVESREAHAYLVDLLESLERGFGADAKIEMEDVDTLEEELEHTNLDKILQEWEVEEDDEMEEGVMKDRIKGLDVDAKTLEDDGNASEAQGKNTEPKKVAEKKAAPATAGEEAPVMDVQKARKVQKKVVKGLHGTRFNKDQGRRLEAITEEEESGDQEQKFTLPIHETTNPGNTGCLRQWDEEDAACLSIAVEEQNHRFTACLIQKAVEEYSLVEDSMGEEGGKERHGSLKTYDIKSSKKWGGCSQPTTRSPACSPRPTKGTCPSCSMRPTRGTCSS